MKMAFTKMHGLGNDFVVIDATTEKFTLSAKQIRLMADRRLGIGFDQLLVLEASHSTEVDFNYRIFNADGSEVGQCGNGARCVTRYIKEQKLSPKKQFILQTKETHLQTRWHSNQQISVQMGIPVFHPPAIPMQAAHYQALYQLQLTKNHVEFAAVNIGNPHAVLFVDEYRPEFLQTIGPELSTHAYFPAGVNVGFMQVLTPNHVRLQVYERGAGATLACGSGACAAMILGRKNGLLAESVLVSQPGGDLTIEWQGENQPVIMSGPAEFVYQGEYLLDN